MEKQNHPFSERKFDKSYNQLNRSYKLTWNQKALLNHIITWQEKIDENGNNRVCFESNSVLAGKLGIPFKTFEQMISTMNKVFDFFVSKGTPGKGKSRNGGNYNQTTKIVYIQKLIVFLEAEQREIEANGGEPPSDRKKRMTISNPGTFIKDPSTSTTLSKSPDIIASQAALVEDGTAPKTKADAFKMIKRIVDNEEFSGTNKDDIKQRLISAIETHVVAYKFKEQLTVWLDDYINNYLLIAVPPKRKVETEEDWYNRKSKEKAQKEAAGVEYGNLYDGLDDL